MSTTQANGMTFDMGTGNGPWRFTLENIYGWRVCGLTVPKTPAPSTAPSSSPAGNSATPTPSPT